MKDSFANVFELLEVQFIIVVCIEELESLRRQIDNNLKLSNGGLDDNYRWESVDVVVVVDLVDVLHGASPEGKFDLPLGKEPVPVFVD